MSDPWIDLPAPDSTSDLAARRVDEESRAALYWARDAEGRCTLLLSYECSFPPDVRIPRLKGLSISKTSSGPGRGQLLFRLEEAALRDIFTELCRDIVATAHLTESDEAAIRTTVSRTWRWYYLLKGSSGQVLSEEKQKGLISELLAVELLSEKLDPALVLDSWTGPLGEPMDFIFPGGAGIECKAIRGTDAPFVQVNSEFQLDTHGIHMLHLWVCEVSRSIESESNSLTLTGFATRVRNLIYRSAPGSLSILDSRLLAAGFRPEDDYSEFWWTTGDPAVYDVRDGFPCIQGSDLPRGIQRVTYTLLLKACAHHRLEVTTALGRLEAAYGS